MIKNFEVVKAQLADLAPVINSFKSEAVQLRIVELVFQGVSPDLPTETPGEATKPARRRRPRKPSKPPSEAAGEPASNAAGKKRTTPKKPGPTPVLKRLIEEGFFKTRRKMGDIVEHANNNMATPLKSTSISGTLGALVRQGNLKREKGADDQFEYYTE